MTETATSSETRGPAVGLEQIAEELLAADKIVVASHLNPDGDALGSSRALALLLQSIGKDVIVYNSDPVVPAEYDFITPPNFTSEVPEDIEDRLLVAVDCGNASRVRSEELFERATRILNIDHHGDNTHFGHLNHVRASAACTTQLVWELAGHLGIDEPGREVAIATYVGLVTDTGRFQYSNTTSDAFELAAQLVRSGVDVHDVFTRIFESVGWARTKLLGTALRSAVRTEDGLIVATHLTQDDFDLLGATEDDAEGIVDALRSVAGTSVALFLRDLDPSDGLGRKGSLRTTREDLDVSIIARSWNGGGHRQAAGFNTTDDLETVLARVDAAVRAQIAAS
ncbi:MAG: phosphoesterase RecJ domain protein [Thermoleophilia bacterium]|nr:phosphoesterase RecJ domain protein [Thermoleophilia bacterium]